jgi:formylglycine-generating enzyme
MKTLPLLLLVPASVALADPGRINVHLSDAVSMTLIQVPEGSYTQGSPEAESGRGADEGQRQVRISKAFYLAKYPVTVKEWRLFARESGYRTEAEKGQSGGFGWDGKSLVQSPAYTWQSPGFTQTDDHPVTTVTWDDAQAFLRWMSSKTGMICRLPTEAEWEYANRAGAISAWPGTNDRVGALTSIWSLESSPGTQPVGKHPENAWGFSDMNGQVWEWCADWYGPYEKADVVDPLQKNPPPGDKARRVLRGGSFTKTVVSARSAARYRNDPTMRTMAFVLRRIWHRIRPSSLR